MEALKRLTCRVKGQIGVREFLWEMRVARLAECRHEQKAGYVQSHQSHSRIPCQPILPLLVRMRNNGLSESHIKFVSKSLSRLAPYINLDEPEKVKSFVATLNVSDGYKKNLITAYAKYCQYYKIKWNKPKYHQEARQRRIPTTTHACI